MNEEWQDDRNIWPVHMNRNRSSWFTWMCSVSGETSRSESPSPWQVTECPWIHPSVNMSICHQLTHTHTLTLQFWKTASADQVCLKKCNILFRYTETSLSFPKKPERYIYLRQKFVFYCIIAIKIAWNINYSKLSDKTEIRKIFIKL